MSLRARCRPCSRCCAADRPRGGLPFPSSAPALPRRTSVVFLFFFQAEDGIRDLIVTGVQTCALPILISIITFDDGWKSQYEVAWPIMKKFNYPFTLFIYTEGIKPGHFSGGESMSWEQLAEMRDAGIDIQGHTATHSDLRKPYDKVAKKKLNPQEYEEWLNKEIAGSKQMIEQKLGVKVNCFAVPYGFHNDHIRDVVMKAGY